MKKLLLLFAAVGMIFTACQSGSLDDGSNGGNGNGGGEVYDPNNPLSNQKCSNNELLYISKSCLPMELSTYDGWGAKLISNTYENGVGRLTFNGEVTTIPESAFYGNELLEFFKMPKSVTSIGWRAFSGCSSLAAFYGKFASADNRCLIIDGVLNSFAPAGLTEYTIPDSVTSIGNYAFCYCSSLQSATIGNSVTSIGKRAFYECTSLTSVTIGNSVTSIGERAFSGCTGELTVNCNIPSASSSEYGAFYGSKFTKVTIGNSVTSIGNYAFHSCTGELIINSKKLVETNYSSSDYPMEYGWLCGSKFTKLTIGNSVTSIGYRAFSSCTSLTSVTIPDSVTSIGSYAFSYCRSLTSVTIPDSVTKIGNHAFYDCSRLTSVTIPDSVTSIGEHAFRGCSSLASVTIPDSVTSIGELAFDVCSSLQSVTIGNSVTSIGKYAFSDCTSLKEVYCKPTTPPTGGGAMFSYGYFSGGYLEYKPIGCKIYVPRNSVSAYKSAQYWSKYADYIEGYDF